MSFIKSCLCSLLNRFYRYQVIYRFGQVCTAILCSHTHPNQVFVATADSCVKCVNIGIKIWFCCHGNHSYTLLDTHQVTGTVGPHETTVKSLSLHQSGRYLLVVTSCDSVLWDIQTGHRCRTLSGGETVGVQNVSWAFNILNIYLFIVHSYVHFVAVLIRQCHYYFKGHSCSPWTHKNVHNFSLKGLLPSPFS